MVLQGRDLFSVKNEIKSDKSQLAHMTILLPQLDLQSYGVDEN